MKSAQQVVAQQENTNGWLAQLELGFAPRPQKTVLAHRIQRGPLAVQRPFYPEGEVCHLYLLHPPGGVVGGDQLYIDTKVAAGAHAVVTTPGATKFYRSGGETALQQQTLHIASSGVLEWLPQETIYFPGAIVNMKTCVELEQESRFIGWETHCFGLPANKEVFDHGLIRIQLEVMQSGQPVILENMLVDAQQLCRPTGLRGYPVMSTMIAKPATQSVLDSVRDILETATDSLFSATLLEDCLIVRYLGDSTAESRDRLIQVWNTIRPLVIGREACLPRIWST